MTSRQNIFVSELSAEQLQSDGPEPVAGVEPGAVHGPDGGAAVGAGVDGEIRWPAISPVDCSPS